MAPCMRLLLFLISYSLDLKMHSKYAAYLWYCLVYKYLTPPHHAGVCWGYLENQAKTYFTSGRVPEDWKDHLMYAAPD